ncbi:MAG: N-formylglutamate amidohydrolase [Pseudomonadota bacterium]
MQKLLDVGEQNPFALYNRDGTSAFLFTGDHAGNKVPRSLDMLGLGPEELDRHIGIDIGVEPLGRMLADRLDAAFLYQPYSRLVIDCNRPPHQADAIPEVSDGTTIPGNVNLTPQARQARVAQIFDVYHLEFAAELQRRAEEGRRTVIIALHSFTPHHSEFPEPRPWHIGVLWNRDNRLARPLVKHLRVRNDRVVGENQPYRVSDELDYAIPVYGEAAGVLSVELEVRQDLVSDQTGCEHWAGVIAAILPAALDDFDAENTHEVV